MKYYKYIARMEYTYRGYERSEYDFIGLKSVLCIISVVIDVAKDIDIFDVEDCDALDKHMNWEMKCRGSSNGDGGRKKEYATPLIAVTHFKRLRPSKGTLVFVNMTLTSIWTPLLDALAKKIGVSILYIRCGVFVL